MGTPPRRHGSDEDGDGPLSQTVRALVGQREWERDKRRQARNARYDHASRLAQMVMTWVIVAALTAFALIGVLAAWKHWR